MYTIENEWLKAGFDEQARLVYLEDRKGNAGNVIEKAPDRAFLLNCKTGENWETVVFGEKQTFAVQQTGQSLVFRCETLSTRDTALAIALTLTVSLEVGELRFDAAIDNRESDALVTDLEYPVVGIIKRLGGAEPSLLLPEQSGIRIDRVGTWLADLPESRESIPYSCSTCYPGANGSMHWLALEGDGTSLFLQCRDEDHYSSVMRAEGNPEDRGAINLVLGIMPFVKPQESWAAPQSSLMLYEGTWHKGADTYRAWAQCFESKHRTPQWINDMLGYFLVINKQQYGYEMWPYATLPKLYEMAQAHGCETLGLFGWYDSGHDNQYPDLTVSESLGGAEALRENIRQVQEAGGRVTLYQQGHLIDPTTAYYRDGGYRYETRDKNGLPYRESYNKAHRSMFLKHYTDKYFALSCPSCPEWRDLMREKVEWAKTFAPDGVLFDQIGGMPAYPCFNEDHPHDKGKPSLSISGGRKKLLAQMQATSKEGSSEFAFFSEHITDVYSAHLDCLHGIGALPSPEGAYLGDVPSQGKVNEPSLFRYCFPRRCVTIRNARPYIPQRAANYAFTFGFVYEMEIRYQADCDDILADKWPQERVYAQKVSALRKQYLDALIHADFVDQRPLATAPDGIIAKAYESPETIAVALWNDAAESRPLTLSVKDATLTEYATIDETRSQLPASMPGRSIALAIFTRSQA